MGGPLSPLAGKPIDPSMLLDVPHLVTAYFTGTPDPGVPSQRVAFGTSGHRGSAYDNAFNETHILAISQTICHYRKRNSPFAHTMMAKYLTAQIDALEGEITQGDVARALNYPRSNVISMFKTGEIRVPLEKVPDLAMALHVDVGHLMRLGLEQYWPDKFAVINTVFGRTVTANEMEIIEVIREASNNADPNVTKKQKAQIAEIFDQ